MAILSAYDWRTPRKYTVLRFAWPAGDMLCTLHTGFVGGCMSGTGPPPPPRRGNTACGLVMRRARPPSGPNLPAMPSASRSGPQHRRSPTRLFDLKVGAERDFRCGQQQGMTDVNTQFGSPHNAGRQATHGSRYCANEGNDSITRETPFTRACCAGYTGTSRIMKGDKPRRGTKL